MTVASTTDPAARVFADALHTVAVNGAYNASRALSKWLKKGVHLETQGFESLPLDRATSFAGETDEPVAAIHLSLAGDLSGHLLLTFSERVALCLADIMLGMPAGTSTALTELEQSCLQETGNIVGTAYANSLAKWLKLHLEPQVPEFAFDMASSIIDPMVAELALYSDEVYSSSTLFLVDGQELEWGLLLLPSQESLKVMEARCDQDNIRGNALQTIAVNGAFNASRAMSKWIKRGVKISTDGFSQVPLAESANVFEEDTTMVALHMPLMDQLLGHTLLGFRHDDACKLVDLLMGQSVGTTTTFGEIERSCLEETGNIVASAFVNSWSGWLDVKVKPGAPEFVVDLPGAVIGSLISEQALVSDEVFLTRTEFVVDGELLEWVFMLMPAPSALRLIQSSCT